MKNIKEFKALIERYESITLEEIDKYWINNAWFTASMLTGYGVIETCSLCQPIGARCADCVYGMTEDDFYACCSGDAKETYISIEFSETPQELLTAYRERAKFMRELLKQKQSDKA